MTMNLNVLLTIADAAGRVKRTERAVYKWVSKGLVRSTRDSSGRIVIRYSDLLEAEANIKRGRPPGTPTRR